MKHLLTILLFFALLCGSTCAIQPGKTVANVPRFDTIVPLSDFLELSIKDSVVYLNGLTDAPPLALGPIGVERWRDTKIKYLQRDYITGKTKYLDKYVGTTFIQDTTGKFVTSFTADTLGKSWKKKLRAGLLRKNPLLDTIGFDIRYNVRLKEDVPLREITLVSGRKQAFWVNEDSTVIAGPPDLKYRQTFFSGRYFAYYDPAKKARIIMTRKGATVLFDKNGILDAMWEMAYPVISVDDYDNLDDKYIYNLEQQRWVDTVEVGERLSPDTYFTSSMDGLSAQEVDLFVKGEHLEVTNFSRWPIQLKQYRYDHNGVRTYRKANGDTLWVEPVADFPGEELSLFHTEAWLQRGRDSLLNVKTGESIPLLLEDDSASLAELIFDQEGLAYGWGHTYFIDSTGEYRDGSYMMDLRRQLVSPVWLSIFHLQDNLFVVRNEKKQIGVLAWR